MSSNIPRRKLRFPGILEKQAKEFRERLLATEKTARTTAFKKAADGLLPGWDGK